MVEVLWLGFQVEGAAKGAAVLLSNIPDSIINTYNCNRYFLKLYLIFIPLKQALSYPLISGIFYTIMNGVPMEALISSIKINYLYSTPILLVLVQLEKD